MECHHFPPDSLPAPRHVLEGDNHWRWGSRLSGSGTAWPHRSQGPGLHSVREVPFSSVLHGPGPDQRQVARLQEAEMALETRRNGTGFADSILSHSALSLFSSPPGVSVCWASRDGTQPLQPENRNPAFGACPVLGPEFAEPRASVRLKILPVSLAVGLSIGVREEGCLANFYLTMTPGRRSKFLCTTSSSSRSVFLEVP